MADLVPINITSNTDKPDVSVLTSKELEGGTGVFDILMETNKLHLINEYDEGRITGKEYTTVYLGSLQAILQAAIAFIADHSNNAKTNAEIGLLRQKIVTELSMTDEDIPAGLGFNNGTTIDGLNKAIQNKTLAEITLTDQKSVTELAQTGDILPADFGLNLSTSILGITEAQLNKAAAEETLLKQKSATELSQTSDTIPAGTALNPGTTVEGVIKTQKDLFVKQTDGFDRDAEQKLVKMMIDTWTVRRSTDEGTGVGANGLDDGEINKILDVAKNGIGSTGSAPVERLYFDAGANAFEISDAISDVTGSTATVLGVVLQGGSWDGNDASGYLVLTDVVGPFHNDENLTSTRLGATVHAIANGVVILV